jgi:hypothetical protein
MSKTAELDLNDPFSVGQLVGMLVILTYIENNNGINQDHLEKLKMACADKSANYLQKPTEDIFLLVNNLVKNINKI